MPTEFQHHPGSPMIEPTIGTEWFPRDSDGDWKPWRHHRYSPLP
jgi:hypothetical protein